MRNSVIVLLGVLFMFGVVVGYAANSPETPSSEDPSEEPGADGDTGDASGGETILVEMTDSNEYVPETVHVEVGDTVKWVNTGQVPHTVTPDEDEDAWPAGVEGSGDEVDDWLGAEESWSYTFEATGTYSYHCIPHASEADDGTMQGMTGTVVVHEEGQAPSDDADETGFEFGEPREVTIDEISRHPSDMPANTTWTRYDDGAYTDPVERGDAPVAHEVHFDVEEGTTELLPNTTTELWTFDGTIPGPMIRVQEGDSVNFTLHNPEDSSLPHNVDFHAVTGPGGGAVALDTDPGASSQLNVRMLNPGIYVYHCAFGDVPTHIAHGMYGLIVVEPEGGLDEVDEEYYMMQSEYYTEAGGEESLSGLEEAGHLDFDASYGNLEEPTFVQWNGRPNSIVGERALGAYDTTLEVNDTARLFVGNIGPNLVSSFHVIGEIFDRVYVEGSFDLVNENVQSTLVPAGGAVGVEMTFEVPGTYIPLDHSIFRMHKGLVGHILVDGEPNHDVYDPVEEG